MYGVTADVHNFATIATLLITQPWTARSWMIVPPVKTSSVLHASSSVVVIGGGVSGLVAAASAASNGANDVVSMEASDRVGGRVQTDKHLTSSSDGSSSSFLLDRGFAVFLDAYPSSQRLLDYEALVLRQFVPGALIMTPDRGMIRIADPLRQPSSLLDTILFPIGTLQDKQNIARLLWHVRSKTIEQLFVEEELDTENTLRYRWKLSDEMIDQFFRPFLQGIYLTSLNQQSSHMLHFVFKMFSEGNVSLPAAGGMAAVSEQLKDHCDSVDVQVMLDTKVDSIEKQMNGSYKVVYGGHKNSMQATTVIVATESPTAHKLLQKVVNLDGSSEREQRMIGCVYYSFKTEEPPVKEPILVLNGTGEGPVNNLCFPSVVASSYAPQGTHLCSITVLEHKLSSSDENLDLSIRQQLSEWFPNSDVAMWHLERIYRIPNAQPSQFGKSVAHPQCDTFEGHNLPPGILVCGDHVASASLHGALTSGEVAGEMVRQQQRL